MKKAIVCLLVSLGMLPGLTSCGKQPAPVDEPQAARQTVELTVWGAEEDAELLQEMIASFQTYYSA